MVCIDDYFGNYLKIDDIKGDLVVEIEKTKVESLGQGENKEDKIIVYFDGIEKGLALNKINSEAIAEIAGSRETDSWVKKKICLYVDPNVMFAGKRVGGVRVKAVK